MRLLVVEDEPGLRDQLCRQLTASGFSVDQAADGEEGLFYGREYPFDLAVVDIGLPKLDGVALIRQLREMGREFPILILTARGSWQEKVEGLESGADDYLVKPFHYEELLARINALLRRAAGHAKPEILCGDIRLDSFRQRVTLKGEAVDLTAYEYKVLEYLLLNQEKVISKTELTEHIYDQDFDRDSNVIEVFVRRLRKKLNPAGEFDPIETLRGRGYRMRSRGKDT